MMQAETEQRLVVAERQVAELRVEVAKLNVLVGVLLHRDAPEAADTAAVVQALGVIKETSPRGESRSRLSLVREVAS